MIGASQPVRSSGDTRGWMRASGFLRSAGRELISGASDNYPTNVGTAVAVGAQTGYALSWVAVLVAPLVAASVAGGLGTPIGLVLRVRLARDPEVMGSTPISRRLAVVGWAVALVVAGFGAAFVLGAVLGWP